jgi:hypothetical protein
MLVRVPGNVKDDDRQSVSGRYSHSTRFNSLVAQIPRADTASSILGARAGTKPQVSCGLRVMTGCGRLGAVEYVEDSFDVIDDRAPWQRKEWSTAFG